MADYLPPATPAARPPITAALIVYALFAIAAISGVVSSGLVTFAPLVVIAGIVGVIVAFVITPLYKSEVVMFPAITNSVSKALLNEQSTGRRFGFKNARFSPRHPKIQDGKRRGLRYSGCLCFHKFCKVSFLARAYSP